MRATAPGRCRYGAGGRREVACSCERKRSVRALEGLPEAGQPALACSAVQEPTHHALSPAHSSHHPPPLPRRRTKASCPVGSATTASPAAGWASCARSKSALVRGTCCLGLVVPCRLMQRFAGAQHCMLGALDRHARLAVHAVAVVNYSGWVGGCLACAMPRPHASCMQQGFSSCPQLSPSSHSLPSPSTPCPR